MKFTGTLLMGFAAGAVIGGIGRMYIYTLTKFFKAIFTQRRNITTSL